MKSDPGEIHCQKALVAQFVQNPAGSAELLEAPLRKGADQAIRYCNTQLTPQEREDIVQEAFLKAFTALTADEWDGRARLETWMCTITKRLIVDHCRHRRTDPLARAVAITAKEPEADVQPHNDSVSLEKLKNYAPSSEVLVEAHRLTARMPVLVQKIVEGLAAGYSITAIAAGLDQEKQWGNMYPLKVQQILEKFRAKLR